MKRIIFFCVALTLLACNSKHNSEMKNPFLSNYQTPFNVPPFDQIKEAHFLEAFNLGMEEQLKNIEAIINNPDAPNFQNTLVALEKSDPILSKVNRVFFNLTSAKTNDQLQAISEEVSPLLASHQDNMLLNPVLFERIKQIYDGRSENNYTQEQLKLIDHYYKIFKRSGAELDDNGKAKLREINKELSLLSVKFSKNVLSENNDFQLIIKDSADLAGLPQNVIAGAAETAESLGKKGNWIFTLHRPSIGPFLQYAENRELRKEIYTAYINRGNNNNASDNKVIAAKILSLSSDRAKLLGYPSHAAYVLEERVAKNPENVYELLHKLWTPAVSNAKKEVEEMQKIIDEEGGQFALAAWDWPYYAEKVRKAKYDLDDEMIRPYFQLENVTKGLFYAAEKLFGLTFLERKEIPVYHDDVIAYEVLGNKGEHVGILMFDFFPRDSKKGGAWMTNYLEQSDIDTFISPVVSLVTNFSKPVGDQPALLNFEEVSTLYHEFGHGLHGLLSRCHYPSISGTAVPRDFVELPSQIMENWAAEPEMMAVYAKHYQTGEIIPQELIDKIINSSHFNQGFASVEYLAASLLDMDLYTAEGIDTTNIMDYEKQSFDKMKLPAEIDSRYRTTYFNHIFSSESGYSAGYYSYIWAEVLDADAFSVFKEKGIFDQETAQSFRENILEKGGTDDAMEMYRKFRGEEPKIAPLLDRRGLN